MTRQRTFLAIGVLVALVLAGVISGFASSSPDGLEKVAHEKGFGTTETEHGLSDSPLAGYGVEGIQNARVSGGLAGVIGVVVTLAIGSGLFVVLRRRGTTSPGTTSPGTTSSGDGQRDEVPSGAARRENDSD
jgi:hypothetical protein